MAVTTKRTHTAIPTYVTGKPNTLPFFLEKKAYQGATGRVYPIPYTDRLSDTAQAIEYDLITLENEHIRVNLLPELGGKIHGAHDKHNGYDFIYENTVIKPAMVGLAGPWVSGGVEFNWPQHHRPTTYLPTEATCTENPDGSHTVWMGEAEPFHRMRGMVGITVYPGKSYVEAKAVVYNRTDLPLPFMWWNNLAVRVHDRYKATFPPDVAYGNDHDRRAVIPFPVMRGVYETARPFDYGEGTDATWFSNVKLPTSVMVSRFQSDMDFVGGYDFAADAGTVTVSDHHLSPGKKMWTWGDGPFGRAWCANLTDNGDRYIELMTGVYTDNQPDFTYIQPGETKVFTQVWYPIHTIGEVKNATLEGAVSLDIAEGEASFGGLVTGNVPGARLRLLVKGLTIAEQAADLTPADSLRGEAALPNGTSLYDVRVELLDAAGRVLAAHQQADLSGKQPPKARVIPPLPKEIDSQEDLYLHAAHLEQYKHHTWEAEAYYREALRRDADDLRCNLGLGRMLTEKGDFDAARTHLQRAIDRLRMRNDNPADTEAIYLLARVERLCGNLDRAYDLYWQAAWQYSWRSPSYYEIACIDCLRGEREKAVEHLRLCLQTNTQHFAARTLLGYLTKDMQQIEAVLADAPQDAYARYCRQLLGGAPLEAFSLGRAEDMLDIALDLSHAGLVEEAVSALQACTAPNQLTAFHLAHLTGKPAADGDMTLCFPNRLEDIAALQGNGWRTGYLLGCLYYDRLNHAAAIGAWQRALADNPSDAFTLRNLAQALFDHGGDQKGGRAMMRKALACAPDNARILYELLQMEKNLDASVRKRLDLLEAHAALAAERDDCYLDWIILYTLDGQYDRARALLLDRRFHIYEGGEGKLTRHHGWLYTLMGRTAHLAGNTAEAREWYETALVYPASYGEGRHYSAQEGNIYYFLGLLLADTGEADAARDAFRAAVSQSPQITEMTVFSALAAQALGEKAQAQALFRALVSEGQRRLNTLDLWGYFGVGMPAPLPSELDIARQNGIAGNLLLALGRSGLGDAQGSLEAVRALEALDPYNASLAFLRNLEVL